MMSSTFAATTSTVASHEITTYDSRKSSYGTLVCVTAMISSRNYARDAAAIVQTSRECGDAFDVIA
ncbi:hypothetical protein IQ285_29265 [Burkholderia sp. R-69608]|uniref:hypothetical protein n=1 Tax=Paraburkholderia nemoris TaxID=2793076 RepID=UPI001912A4B3|nr:hypothetical protein [Paraburkholderia nemoris]MBK5151791.1 hypothetical protein [Burkholderia sp. R-69608]